MTATSTEPTLRDRWKSAWRTLRYHVFSMVAQYIRGRPVEDIPRLRRALRGIFSLAFHRERLRATQLLPLEFQPRCREILDGMLDNQIMNILEIFLYEKLLAKRPEFIHVSGQEHLERARAAGRGFLFLSGHFGNWELIAYTIARLGYPLHVIARPQAINRMTEFMNQFREERQVKVLMANNLSDSLRILHQGQGVGIVSDLNARERGYRVPFFGREASFYPTPVILSLRGRAPLIPSFIERQPDGSQNVRFEPPIEWEEGESMPTRIRKYVVRLEEAIRRRPDQWVWFHERYQHAELGRAA